MAEKRDGKIPTLHIKAQSIPEAYYKAINAVHNGGYEIRTQYDRKDPHGNYIEPPSKDAKVMIEVLDPFAQPRFPVLSYCERGKYIAEFLGAKDHLVMPHKKLLEMISDGKEFEPTQWPYCYHQRLAAYPKSDGSTLNQLERIIGMLAKDTNTRRAIAITGVPEVDLFIKSDQPCLREIQLRAVENNDGKLVLNMHARWRSRDLYKAWGDNVIGITNLQARLACSLAEKIGREVIAGPYTEENGSLHIYGQDYTEKGMNKFFDNFPNLELFTKRASTSLGVKDTEIIPQLRELKAETTWNFPPEAIDLIDTLIEDYETGRFLP
ncbi:hypothetical protein HYT26_00640 [Candidatus Pacearchaeota archaeon]|nr:hypothetical protein [Candidatus Pacearchaeota archaeon]